MSMPHPPTDQWLVTTVLPIWPVLWIANCGERSNLCGRRIGGGDSNAGGDSKMCTFSRRIGEEGDGLGPKRDHKCEVGIWDPQKCQGYSKQNISMDE